MEMEEEIPLVDPGSGIVNNETVMNPSVEHNAEPPDDELYNRERNKKIAELKTEICEMVYKEKWVSFCKIYLVFSEGEINYVKERYISPDEMYENIKKFSYKDYQKLQDLFGQHGIKKSDEAMINSESGSEAEDIYRLIDYVPLRERYNFVCHTLENKEIHPTQLHDGIFPREVMEAMLECYCERENTTYDRLQKVKDVAEKNGFLKRKSFKRGFMKITQNATYDRLQQVIDVGEKMKFLKPKKNTILGKLQKLMDNEEGKEESEEAQDRLEDVFQEETIKAFLGIIEFKMFARFELCLDEQDIQDIVENNKSNVEKQKLQFLNKWKENNGKQATVEKIRKLVATYKKGDDPEGTVAEEIVVDTCLVTSIVDCEYKETMDRVKELIEKMKIRQLGELEELKFCLCHLKKKHLEEFLSNEVLKAVVCKISKLSIGFTENVTDLIPLYCQIASNYKSTNLSLEFNDLRNEDIEALAENLNENDKYMELEISYNKNIKPDGYETVGKIVRKHEIRTLKLADCDISDEDLEYLFKGMGNAKLEVLDISCNDNVTTKGFEHIGKQIAQKRIKKLKLSDTQLNVDTLNGFYEKVAGSIEDSEGYQVLVEELDVSYNSTMKPKAYKVLGLMVKLFGVKTLNLAGCGLGEEHLKHLREEMNPENSTKKNKHYTKMESLNARDNKVIGKGIDEIAKIVKECELKELDISKCRLSANELKKFIAALENGKLKCLYLGEERQFDKIYITEVCKLLPHIKEMSRLKGTVRTDLRKMLQEKLNKLEDNELEIKLDDDTTLCSQIEDDVSLSNSS